jgi:hypothetical protein
MEKSSSSSSTSVGGVDASVLTADEAVREALLSLWRHLEGVDSSRTRSAASMPDSNDILSELRRPPTRLLEGTDVILTTNSRELGVSSSALFAYAAASSTSSPQTGSATHGVASEAGAAVPLLPLDRLVTGVPFRGFIKLKAGGGGGASGVVGGVGVVGGAVVGSGNNGAGGGGGGAGSTEEDEVLQRTLHKNNLMLQGFYTGDQD